MIDPIVVEIVDPVIYEAAAGHIYTVGVDGGQTVLGCERNNPLVI